MTALLREMMSTFRASPAFSLAVLITLAVAGVIGLMVLLMQVQPGFMGMAHFTEPHHRVHDVTFGLLFSTGVVGMLAQLRRPLRNVAGQLMALIPWVGLMLAAILSATPFVFLSAQSVSVAALTLIATLLHPAGRDFFRSFSVSRVNWVLLAMVVIAAVPLLSFGASNIGLQTTATNDHAALGHYGFMAAFSSTVIAVGLLASLRPDGWRLTAWVAGLLPAALGLTSLIFPGLDSGLDLLWATAAIAWGVAFVVAAEFTPRVSADTQIAAVGAHPGSAGDFGRDGGRRSTTRTPRWVYVLGIVLIIVPVLLFVIMHMTGGGFWAH